MKTKFWHQKVGSSSSRKSYKIEFEKEVCDCFCLCVRERDMNDADVSKQIQQMVRFIRQEAEEKANEISISAEEEFNIERLQLLETAKRKLRQDYDRKLKQVDIRKRM